MPYVPSPRLNLWGMVMLMTLLVPAPTAPFADFIHAGGSTTGHARVRVW